MPKYEYKCTKCDARFVEERSMSAEQELTHCPDCDTLLLRVYSAPVVTFNGSGFYATDKKK